MTVAVETSLHPSLVQLLRGRGFVTPEQIEALLNPSLDTLAPVDSIPHMDRAVRRMLQAIQKEEPIAIYADRDADGLTGMAILVRSLRTLGADVGWGSPLKGRGVDPAVVDELLAKGAKLLILVDCGTGEHVLLERLKAQGVDVIVADHHRLPDPLPPALAWIHPEVTLVPRLASGGSEQPAGCVMAFKLAQGLWTAFLGKDDPERMNYFLFDHLDLLALGILADRMPLVGENRTLVWHGLWRLARTRKAGLSQLLRFYRLTPRSGPISVREATWQLIPLLNAAGRLGQPEVCGQLLLTEDAYAARDAIDALMSLNAQRRTHQQKSQDEFEKMVLEQCQVDVDPVLVVLAKDVEPSVTGLAAQSLVRKYGRPAFLFVEQGDEAVGSGRGTDDVDLFAWVESHKELLVKFGGHQGAVGLTVRQEHFATLRAGLLAAGSGQDRSCIPGKAAPEADLSIDEADESWWNQLQALEPFGPGFPCPVFRLTGIRRLAPATKRSQDAFRLFGDRHELSAEFEETPPASLPTGPVSLIGYPVKGRKAETFMKWVIQKVETAHG